MLGPQNGNSGVSFYDTVLNFGLWENINVVFIQWTQINVVWIPISS